MAAGRRPDDPVLAHLNSGDRGPVTKAPADHRSLFARAIEGDAKGTEVVASVVATSQSFVRAKIVDSRRARRDDAKDRMFERGPVINEVERCCLLRHVRSGAAGGPGRKLSIPDTRDWPRASGRWSFERASRRFARAHEAGHWVCQAEQGHEAPVYWRAADVAPTACRAMERETNVFAAELLMPGPAVREQFERVSAAELAGWFSDEAMSWRLYNVTLVDMAPGEQ